MVRAGVALALALAAGRPAPAWASNAGEMVGAITLHGCPAGDYWVVGAVGGQRVHLLLDSGSTTLAVASSRCRGCDGVAPLYTPALSAHDEHLRSEASYGDGSGWRGEIFTDTVALPGMHAAVSMRLVAIDRQKDFFTDNPCGGSPARDSPYQGILGMGPAALAVPNTDGLVPLLGARADHPLHSFATALCDQGGRLWLGTFDPRVANGPTQFTAMVPDSPFYAVSVADLQLSGSSLGYQAKDFGPMVVDTGTSDIVLPAAIATNLTRMIEADPVFQAEIAGNGGGWFSGGSCNPAASMDRTQLDAHLPALTFVLPPAHGEVPITVTLSASHSYLTVLDRDGTRVYCPAVAAGDQTILGSAAMRSHIITFDGHGSQVGFTPHHLCGGHGS